MPWSQVPEGGRVGNLINSVESPAALNSLSRFG